MMVKRVELNRILDFSVGIQMIIALLAMQCKLYLEEASENRGVGLVRRDGRDPLQRQSR